MKITFVGLSITSSWGNGHATTYRALARALDQRGHEIAFLERDVPWYAENRDLPDPSYCDLHLYQCVEELESHAGLIAGSDLVVVGSYVPEGVAVIDWMLRHARGITAFYDIDTPVTLAKLDAADYEYLHPRQIPAFDYYLSFTGGPILRHIEEAYGARHAAPLYCSVDPESYTPLAVETRWDLGYLGTYSPDRQPGLEELLMCVAHPGRGAFVVAGPQYPDEIEWPQNVHRIEHLPPEKHPCFYSAQRFTLNITRADMRRWGYAPSVRLFEAAACGVPIISDDWPGLRDILEPDREIVIALSKADVQHALWQKPEDERLAMAMAARERILRGHTSAHRAEELEELVHRLVLGGVA